MIKDNSPLAGSGGTPDPTKQVRLLDLKGKQVGIVPYSQAKAIAASQEVGLVFIAPSADPPICCLYRSDDKAKSGGNRWSSS